MISVQTERQDRELETGWLQPSDILLVHTKRNFWGWLIRFGTHSYWNHALMVCRVGEKEQDYDSILAVDAKTDGSIVISKVTEYLKKPEKYDVAVKRLRADRFGSCSLYIDLRQRICSAALNEVQPKLGKRLARITNQLARQFTVIFRFLRRKINKTYKPPRLPWNIRPFQVKAFTCGGFVQWCYFIGVLKTLALERNRGRLRDIVFNPRCEKELTVFGLLTTTPADLANSDKLSWAFVTKDGAVREVFSEDDVMSIVAPGHLNRSPGTLGEKHYVKRFVFISLATGISLVLFSLILLSFGITLLALNIAMIALVVRVVFGYIIGCFLDKRVKKRSQSSDTQTLHTLEYKSIQAREHETKNNPGNNT